MNQEIISVMEKDVNGNPTGGTSSAIGIEIKWQDGPIPRDEDGFPMQSPNGAFVEGVISAAIQRMKFYQESKFNCRESAIALTKLEEALMWLNKRTKDRLSRKVEGSHVV